MKGYHQTKDTTKLRDSRQRKTETEWDVTVYTLLADRGHFESVKMDSAGQEEYVQSVSARHHLSKRGA